MGLSQDQAPSHSISDDMYTPPPQTHAAPRLSKKTVQAIQPGGDPTRDEQSLEEKYSEEKS